MRKNGFTIVELLVVMAILLILMSLALPSFLNAREHARYVKWRAYSTMQSRDASAALHYNFEDQTGDETNKRGLPMLRNNAVGGDVQGLGRGGNLEPGHGQLGDNNDPATQPVWNFKDGRFKNKGAMDFDGTDDRVVINKTYGLKELHEFSVAVWAWSDNSISEQIMISFDRSENFRFALKDDGGTRNVAFDTTATESSGCCIRDLRTNIDFTDGEWHLFIGTYAVGGSYDANNDGTPENKRIYVDGKLAAMTGDSTDPHNGTPIGQGGDDPYPGEEARKRTYGFLGVGSEQFKFSGAPGPTLFLDAILDEVYLTEREMSPDEVKEMYISGKPRDRR